MCLESGFSSGRDKIGERVVQKEQFTFSEWVLILKAATNL